MAKKNKHVSIDERLKDEQDAYNKGIDRKKYNAAFGHAQKGYFAKRRNKIFASVLKKKKDLTILEIGSTSWKKFIDFEKYTPKKLVCINLSEKALKQGQKIAQELQTNKKCLHEFKVMDAHNLEYPDQTFDIVFGQEILHHLDFELAIKEFARILKPGGQIVFVEPLGRNPVGKLIRWMTPNKRTAYERPLDKKEIKILKKYFDLELAYNQLFYVPIGALSKFIFKSPKNPLTYCAYKIDLFLEKIFKWTNFGLYYRQIVIRGILK